MDTIKPLQAVFIMMLWIIAHSAVAATTQVKNVRLWSSETQTRVVFDLNKKPIYRLSTQNNPKRIIIDIENASMPDKLKRKKYRSPVLQRIRAAHYNKHIFRIVLDVNQAVNAKSFVLPKGNKQHHRLVVDLTRTGPPNPLAPKTILHTPQPKRDLIIAIDAGHGGKDPGAIGYRKTKEKDITLAIAKRLAVLIERQPGMRPLLIRHNDTYVALTKRSSVAHRAKADLFISIHADSFKNTKARGSSVYILSPKKASSAAAKWLAERENRSGFAKDVGNVTLTDKDKITASILLDMSMTANYEASKNAAQSILKQLGKVNKLHSKKVQQAGFAVLKSPDVPSVLIETAFLSNPYEESRLKQSRFQSKIAYAIMQGIREYFSQHGPDNTHFKQNIHIVSKGDTLSEIAQVYGISVRNLKKWNNIGRKDVIKVDQKIYLSAR